MTDTPNLPTFLHPLSLPLLGLESFGLLCDCGVVGKLGLFFPPRCREEVLSPPLPGWGLGGERAALVLSVDSDFHGVRRQGEHPEASRV